MKLLLYHMNTENHSQDFDWYIFCFVVSLRVVQTSLQNWQQKLEWYLSKNKTVMMMMMKRLPMVNGVMKSIKSHKLLRYRKNSCIARPRVVVTPADQKKRNLIIITMRKKTGLSHMGSTNIERGVAVRPVIPAVPAWTQGNQFLLKMVRKSSISMCIFDV